MEWSENPGPDERARKLEREALSSGDPLTAYEAYRERRAAGQAPAPSGDPDEAHVVATPAGQFTVTVVGVGHAGLPQVYVRSGDRTSRPEVGVEWTFNRVPSSWTGHFARLPSGEWLPLQWVVEHGPIHNTVPNAAARNRLSDTDEGGRLYVPRSASLEDMLEHPGYSTSISLRDRWVGGRSISPTRAQQKKAISTIVPLVNAWLQAHPQLVASGARGRSSAAIESAEIEIARLETEIGQLQRKIGDAYLVELQNRDQRENPVHANPPNDTERAWALFVIEQYASGQIQPVDFFSMFPKLSTDALDYDARMAGCSVATYLTNVTHAAEQLREQVRNATRRQLLDYATYYEQVAGAGV